MLGWASSQPSREERYLRRHGVTVAAERVPGEQSTYVYTDPDGLHRTVRKFAHTWTVDVAYDPQDPGRVVVLRARGPRAMDLALTGSGLVIGLLGAAGAITTVVLALLGAGGFRGRQLHLWKS
ncbi:Mu transposase C-terminal domain-containing protein [Streptomyces sp. NPDC017254]|uniref:Mu transposase C-terminal domain-containing protein n=1 Tax=unclassified Streptomyces TaxID=2593676 RepID=UPI00378ABA1B